MQKHRILLFVATAVLFTAVDLATKEWAEGSLGKTGKVVKVIPGCLDLRFNTNTGAAFGLFQNTPWGPRVLTAISVAAVFFLIYLAFHIKERPLLIPVSLGLVLAGVLGNLHDRLLNDGNVRDFIDAYLGESHWPLFNVADSGITVGVILLVFVSFFPGKKGKKKTPKAAKA